MKQREVVYSPEVEDGLNGLFDFIAARSNGQTAFNYISRIEEFCDGLDMASERGTLCKDIREGLPLLVMAIWVGGGGKSLLTSSSLKTTINL